MNGPSVSCWVPDPYALQGPHRRGHLFIISVSIYWGHHSSHSPSEWTRATPPLFFCMLAFSSRSALKWSYVCWSVCMTEEDRGAETNDGIIIPAAVFKEQNSEMVENRFESESHSLVSDSAIPCTVAAMLLCLWTSPGQNTGVGRHCLLQEIFPTRGLNPGLLLCRLILCHLSRQGSPRTALYVLAA